MIFGLLFTRREVEERLREELIRRDTREEFDRLNRRIDELNNKLFDLRMQIDGPVQISGCCKGDT